MSETVDRALCEAAQQAAFSAYAPYSGFAVGAAVRTASGAVHAGANTENASYGLSLCAEVSALTAASRARDRAIVAVAVVGFLFHPAPDLSAIVTPCGRCRQLIAEFADLSGRDVAVHCCSGDLARIETRTMSELLPMRFGPAAIGMVDGWRDREAALARVRTALAPGRQG